MRSAAYERYKYDLAEVLREAATLVPDDAARSREEIFTLFGRLAEDNIRISVIGLSSSGKTSVMNALLGIDRLPAGNTFPSSIVSTIAYGGRERATVHYDERILTKEIPLDEVPSYVAPHPDSTNIHRPNSVEIRIPSEFLWRGYFFADTPGLNSTTADISAAIKPLVSDARVILLVLSHECPLSNEDISLFRAVAFLDRLLFVILNKQDTVSAHERAHHLEIARTQFGIPFDLAERGVLSLSALDGLNAKIRENRELLSHSGLPSLERRLTAYFEEETRRLVSSMCNRLARFLYELPASPSVGNLLQRVHTISIEASAQSNYSPSESIHSSPHEVDLDSSKTCEICASVNEAIWNYLSEYQYDITHKCKANEDFVRRRGFCPFHAWEHQAMTTPYGICASYPHVADRFAADLRAAAARDTDKHLALDAGDIEAHQICPACEIRNHTENAKVLHLAGRLNTAQPEVFYAPPFLCLPHLQMLAPMLDNPDIGRRLCLRHADMLDRLSAEMRQFALKCDAGRRELASEEERSASLRALRMIAGHPNVNFRRKAADFATGPSASAEAIE